MDISSNTIILHLISIALIAFTTGAAAFPNLIGQIVSSKNYKSLAIFKKDKRVFVKKIGQRIDEYLISDIKFKHVYLTDDKGVIHQLRVGDATIETNSEPKKGMPGIEVDGDQILMTRQLRDHVSSENLVTVMMQAASEPYYELVGNEQVLIGFRIFEIESDSIYDIAGIQNGDIITHIEDTRLDGPLTALNLLRQVKELDKFTFTYLRNGISSKTYVDIVY